jgi:hypothetical protein
VKLTTHLQLVPRSLPHTPSWRSAYLTFTYAFLFLVVSFVQLFLIILCALAFFSRHAICPALLKLIIPTPLLAACNIVSEFTFAVFMTPPPRIHEHHYTNSSRCVPFGISFSWFSWTFLMAYPKPSRRVMELRHILSFVPVWIRNISSIRNLLCVSFKHMLISLTIFVAILDSVRILHSTSPLINHRFSWSLYRTDVPCYHFTVSDECIISDP